MTRSLALPIVLFLLAIAVQAQEAARSFGTVRGKVTDPGGETLVGVSIVLKEEPTVHASTDIDGNYSINVPAGATTTLVFSFFTYRTQEVAVSPKAGEVLIANVELTEQTTEFRSVEVVAKARRSSDTHLEKMRINAATSVDYISGDMMLRTGDSDASAAVKRVTGVSTVGAFVTVRGLADRYVVTTINGSRVPTLDPFTNNLKMDLFPTGLLDNILITKTAEPDLPGDWSGAFVSLNTSDYPERLRVNVSTTLGYAPRSSFQDIVTAARSSTDWLGHDDGLRAIPDGVPSDAEHFPRFVEPDLYQQLTLLGFGDVLHHYGIVSTTPGFQSTVMSASGVLPHLMLTEMGLLPPALLNDPNAVQAAVDAYNSTYDLAYFSPQVNSRLAELNTRFNNANWRVRTMQGSPNFNQSLSIGNQVQLFKKARTPKTLGYLFGFRYATGTEYDPASTVERTNERYDDPAPGDSLQIIRRGTQRISTESNGWNAVGSLSLKVDPNNSFSLMVMPNVLGQNNARYLVFQQPNISGETFAAEDQYYEERKLWVYQYGSRHLVPGLGGLRVEADVSYSDGSRNVLDMKSLQYILPPAGRPITDVDGALQPPARIYRTLDETLLDARLGLELPIAHKEARTRKVKIGGGYIEDQRRNTQSYFTVLSAPGPEHWEDEGRFEMGADGRFPSQYAPFGTFKDNDIGISRILSVYAMSDYALTARLRAVGGLRAEHTDLMTDILRYYEEGLAPDDTSRGTVGDAVVVGGLTSEPKPAVPGRLDQWDLLPSINLIYKLRDSDEAPMNLRLNYFRSLGRPSFREFSVVQLYDYILNAPVFGDPGLRMTRIDNFDLRVERFFKGRNNISLSGFYKRFQDHIELLATAAGGFTWRNADLSRIYGVELEGRVGLTRRLEWRGNVTLMDSRSELTTNATGEPVKYSTPMFGQAPYIVNAMLTYTLDSLHANISVSYNVQGPKLAVSNSELDPDGIRAYEMPRHLLDVTITKTFGEHWGVRLRGRNVLNATQRRAYRFGSGYVVDFDTYTYGPEYALTLSYTIR